MSNFGIARNKLQFSVLHCARELPVLFQCESRVEHSRWATMIYANRESWQFVIYSLKCRAWIAKQDSSLDNLRTLRNFVLILEVSKDKCTNKYQLINSVIILKAFIPILQPLFTIEYSTKCYPSIINKNNKRFQVEMTFAARISVRGDLWKAAAH